MVLYRNPLPLKVRNVGYPWQTVAGEGETWLILRQQIKLPVEELAKVTAVFIAGFSWHSETTEQECQLFTGNVVLDLRYQERRVRDLEESYHDASEEEYQAQALFHHYLKEQPAKMKRSLEEEGTSFPHIVLEGDESYQTKEDIKGDNQAWQLVMPWQAWLNGLGKSLDPRIKRIHVGVIGVKTLLVEVLLKLEKEGKLSLEEVKGEMGYLPREDMVLKVEDYEVQEVLGLTIRRGFYQPALKKGSRDLFLHNLKELSIVFLAKNGVERILCASLFDDEEHRLPFLGKGELPPLSCQVLNNGLKVIKVDEKKFLFNGDYIWAVDYGKSEPLVQVQVKESEVLPPTPAVIPSFSIEVTKRSKPGEKWLKSCKKNQQKNNLKTTMTIKPNSR